MHFLSRTALLVLSLVGVADAAYLSYSKFEGDPLICGPFATGCEIVAKSEYSNLFGIPLSLYGLVLYVLIFLICTFYRQLGSGVTTALLGVSSVGAVASLYFLYIQFFKIHAFCPYCLVSATVSFVIFGLSLFMWKKQKDTVGLYPNA